MVLNVVLLSVGFLIVMLSVVMLVVVAPFEMVLAKLSIMISA